MRSGDWFLTHSGKKWFVTDPHPDDVCIEDIAHHLSLVCRFGGACREFYSVAQHSVYVLEVVRETMPFSSGCHLKALMHDASEAYLGDMVRPLKLAMHEYRNLEKRTMEVINEALDLPFENGVMTRHIKYADNVLLMTERRDLLNHRNMDWTERAEPMDRAVIPVAPETAKTLFLDNYEFLRKLNARKS